VVSVATAFAQSPPAPVRIGPGVTPPRLLSKVEPSYSEEARKAHMEGTVQLEAVVGANGVAGDFKVRRSLGLGLDEEAIRAVGKWRFSPGTKDGAPVAVIAVFDVSFKFLQGRTMPWRVIRASYDSPPGAERPTLTRSEYPKKAPSGRAAVALTFDIDERGEPKNLNIDKSVDSEPEQEIIAAVKKWRFKPARKDGRAVSARATFEFKGSPFTPIGQ
jgi:TonB family protein